MRRGRRLCRPQHHGSLSQGRRGAQGVRTHPPCRGHPVRVLRQRRRVQRPPVQCRCPVPVQRPPSGPPRPVSSAWCPTSGVRCMRPASVRLVSVSTLSAPAGWRSAWVRRTATRIGQVGSAWSHRVRDRSVAVAAGGRVGGGWVDCRADGEQPVAHQDRPSVGKRVRLAHRGQVGGSVRPTTTWWWVARAGMPLGDDVGVCGPTAAPRGSSSPPRSRPTGRGSPV